MNAVALALARTFLKIFLRDRQAIFFSMFFPLVFMVVFGFVSEDEPDPVRVGVVDQAGNALAERFIGSLRENALFEVEAGEEEELRGELLAGERSLVIVIPPGFTEANAPVDLRVVVDAAQVRELSLLMPVLEQGLVTVERELREQAPLFNLMVEDVEARSRRYIDFLVPGLLAFSLMQLAIGGSGYNIVEFRRKGILKRLFVTPLHPRDFILGLVASRSLLCLAQLGILLVIAVFYLDVAVLGDPLSLFVTVLLGTALFLSLGFCIGSLAKTQQTVIAIGNLVVFPQIFLAGVFYSIEALPAWIQPLAQLLPLAFVIDALRGIMIDDLSLAALPLELAGMLAWFAILLLLAVRLFRWKEVAA